jgi:dihydropteroate synthase
VANGTPIVVGASRKSFIRALHDSPPEERLGGSVAAALWAARAGAQVLRVHDVAAHRQALLIEAALAGTSESRAVLRQSGDTAAEVVARGALDERAIARGATQ